MVKDLNILLGITGGIAAYKAVELASQLVALEADVKVVMTRNGARLVGPKKALEIFYIGDPIDADEALRLGLVNRVLPDAELEKETQALAQRLAQGPTLALARAKELVHSSLSESLETQLENERDLLGLSTLSEDFHEGVQAFIEKREPKFKGR